MVRSSFRCSKVRKFSSRSVYLPSNNIKNVLTAKYVLNTNLFQNAPITLLFLIVTLIHTHPIVEPHVNPNWFSNGSTTKYYASDQQTENKQNCILA